MTGTHKVNIELGDIQETLLLPLWARAVETEKDNPIVFDPFAKSIIERINYDFSKIEKGQVAAHQIVWPIRAYNFDRIVRAFLAEREKVSVVNVGAGLDTTFQRVDNGDVRWVSVDLPDVAALRRQLISDSDHEMTIAKSVFDYTWIDDAAPMTDGRDVMFMASGVLCYFESKEVKDLFRTLADSYPSAHMIFDSFSRFAAWGTNRSIMKNSGMASSALIRWHMKRASTLREWVNTLEVIEEYPMLSRVFPGKGLKKRTMWGLKIAGLFRLYNMVHVQL